MKRWFPALALLLGGSANYAAADYVILMLNISGASRGGGAGILGGGMAGAGMGGMRPGGALGGAVGMPGGAAGVGGGPPGPGGAFGMGGIRPPSGAAGQVGIPPAGALGAGGVPPGGALGVGGVPPGGALGAGGVPPGGVPPGGVPPGGVPPGGAFGMNGRPPAGGPGVGGGAPPGAFAGMGGGPPGGAMGASGGFRPPMGAGGAPGMPGGAMGMPGGAMGMPGGAFGMAGGGPGRPGGIFGNFPGMGRQPTQDVDDNSHFIVAVVEVQAESGGDYVKKLEGGLLPIVVRHHWGTAHLRSQTAVSKTILLKDGRGKPQPTVIHRYTAIEYPRAFPPGGTPQPNDVLYLAKWCLEHGLVSRFVEVMDKLVELDKNLPAAKAYAAVKAALQKPAEKNKDAGDWRAKLMESYKIAEKPGYHYALLHTSQLTTAEVDQMLETLENTFRGFYYWWALRGVELPVPQERQLAVLTDKSDDLHRFHGLLTSGPMVGDGFFARRERLTVLSSRRLDESYDALDKFAQAQYRANGVNLDTILTSQKPPRGMDQITFWDAQLVALLLKAMETEAQRTTVSHDASRQLLYAAGLLPRNVSAPEWFLFGMGSFFETSPQSPWPTIGAPSFYWLPLFKELKADGKLEKTAYDTLRKVVTDGYFRSLPPRGEGGSPGRLLHDEALRKARTTSWALAYWLAQDEKVDGLRNVDGLRRYCKELSKLPRDLELDESTLLEAFARAFNAVDGNNKPDPAKLARLANQWFNRMNSETLDYEGLRKQIKEYYKDNQQKTEKNPNPAAGNPAGPGGFVPPGGFRPPGQ
jgi:hypothetical protein